MKTKSILTLLLTLAFCSIGSADEPFLLKRTEITVNVLGAVNKPSRITLPANATILDALAASGSVADGGNFRRVKLVHKSGTEKTAPTTINVKHILDGTASNVVLRDGDTIDVPIATYAIQ